MPLMHDGQSPTRSDERLGFLFAVARDPMLILEKGETIASSIIVDCNQKALELFGYPRQSLLGQPLSYLEVPSAVVSNQRETNGTTNEALHRRSDGQVITVERNIQTVESGGYELLLVACHDVTTERLLEKAILRMQQMDNVGVVSGTLVHDFRNLLVSILANAELALSDLRADDPTGARVSDILHSARRATEIVERVLPSSGGTDQHLRPVDLNEVVADAVALMRPSIADTINLDLDLSDGELAIQGDATQLRQIVMNLVINAAEAIAPGSGQIRVTTGRVAASRIDFKNAPVPVTDPPPNWVHLDVSDTGSGIDANARRRIFEPLFTTKSSGTGLGLTAVLFAIRRHGGTITLRSSARKGSTFRVLFPIVET